ncbi:TPA: hypothetical protein H5X10_004497, partial [Escherichia coli]|nr:hypothetical protein [Escherichia coli]
APGIRSQASCDRLRELPVSARDAIIGEVFPATLVEFIRHFVKLFW